MPVDASFLAFVMEQLRALDGVSSRRMFGGVGLYRHGAIFGIIADDRLYLKTDDTTRPAFVERGMAPFQPSPRQTLSRYYEAPADILEDPDALADWVRNAGTEAGA